MRITDADRELAAEIADIFDIRDQSTIKALAVVLWAHRQRPADSKPVALCVAESPPIGVLGDARVWCDLAAGDHSPHRSGDIVWFG